MAAIFEGGWICLTFFLERTNQGLFLPSFVKICPVVLEEMKF